MVPPKNGQLPERYSFLLNPYTDTRLSKCPRCEKPTHPRKFALFIHIEQWGPLTLGKTCRYCSTCELIIVHQDELEAQLAQTFSQLAPEMSATSIWCWERLRKRSGSKGLAAKVNPWKRY